MNRPQPPPNETDLPGLDAYLREHRERAGLSVAETAHRAGVEESSLELMEQGMCAATSNIQAVTAVIGADGDHAMALVDSGAALACVGLPRPVRDGSAGGFDGAAVAADEFAHDQGDVHDVAQGGRALPVVEGEHPPCSRPRWRGRRRR
ncbi:MAG: helix-turn-helix domain-containing protein [Pseudonocardia sp.]